MQLEFKQVDLNNKEHCKHVIKLLDMYMSDPMGNGKNMEPSLGDKIISGLKTHSAYLGFFLLVDGSYAALANCNKVFSTWQAKSILNIHDLIVSPDHRQKGLGKLMLQKLREFAKAQDFCKITLEVREDNIIAKDLYQKVGFEPGNPPYLFWEKSL